MINFFWKYRKFNLCIIILLFGFCCFNFNTFNVFFDSERIIELTDSDQDIIDKAVDDANLLLVGLSLEDSLSFFDAVKIDSVIQQISDDPNIRSVKSIFNEKAIVNTSILPITIDLFDIDNIDVFNSSLKKIKLYESKFISKDYKSLLFVVKCKNLVSEKDKIQLLDRLNNYFTNFSISDIKITGQLKSEIYIKKSVIKELIFFIVLCSLLCGITLWYFIRSYRLVLFCLISIMISIVFAFTLSNILYGGIELVMIIIPAIIFIITVSDFMHLLNTDDVIKNKTDFFEQQLKNIGKPVFLTSLTTAIGFLSFTFGSFEPLMRFGIITTLSIFIALFIIVTFFAIFIDFNLIFKREKTYLLNKINSSIAVMNNRKIALIIFFSFFSILGIINAKIDNFLTDEINKSSDLYKEINYFEENFGGIKPISFTLNNKKALYDFTNFLDSNNVNTDIILHQNKDILIKSRIRDIGAKKSSLFYEKVAQYGTKNNSEITIGGVGYLFDKISNILTLEVLIGLVIAIFIIGMIFVLINNFNFNYLFVSLIPNIIPLLSSLGVLSVLGFYFNLSNAFIFAIVFGLIVDDSIHIISSYSFSRRRGLTPNEALIYCQKKTFNAVIKTTLIIIASLIPLLFSEFKSISQLGYITILAAVFAIIFDVILLPKLLKKYIN